MNSVPLPINVVLLLLRGQQLISCPLRWMLQFVMLIQQLFAERPPPDFDIVGALPFHNNAFSRSLLAAMYQTQSARNRINSTTCRPMRNFNTIFHRVCQLERGCPLFRRHGQNEQESMTSDTKIADCVAQIIKFVNRIDIGIQNVIKI